MRIDKDKDGLVSHPLEVSGSPVIRLVGDTLEINKLPAERLTGHPL
jgi:hypothetical protein